MRLSNSKLKDMWGMKAVCNRELQRVLNKYYNNDDSVVYHGLLDRINRFLGYHDEFGHYHPGDYKDCAIIKGGTLTFDEPTLVYSYQQTLDGPHEPTYQQALSLVRSTDALYNLQAVVEAYHLNYI